MRQGLLNENSRHIIIEDGSLNFKYFNVKKGHYWSKEENKQLLEGVVKCGACDFKQIRKNHFAGAAWCYDLAPYESIRFSCGEEVLAEAKKN